MTGNRPGQPVIRVNGSIPDLQTEKGYAVIDRIWKKGDVVTVDFPMDVLKLQSDPRVEANEGRLALQRGPLVYCAEWADFAGSNITEIRLDENAFLAPLPQDSISGGIVIITGTAKSSSEQGGVKQQNIMEIPFTAIPYYAWAHRGAGQMSVWIKTTDQ